MIALYSALESSAESTFEENLEIFLEDLKKKDLVFNFDTDFYLSPFLKWLECKMLIEEGGVLKIEEVKFKFLKL